MWTLVNVPFASGSSRTQGAECSLPALFLGVVFATSSCERRISKGQAWLLTALKGRLPQVQCFSTATQAHYMCSISEAILRVATWDFGGKGSRCKCPVYAASCAMSNKGLCLCACIHETVIDWFISSISSQRSNKSNQTSIKSYIRCNSFGSDKGMLIETWFPGRRMRASQVGIDDLSRPPCIQEQRMLLHDVGGGEWVFGPVLAILELEG